MKRFMILITVIAAAYLSVPGAAVAQGENDTLWAKRIKGVKEVKFSPDGKTIAVGRENGEVYFLNSLNGDSLYKILHPGGVTLDYSPDGKYLLTGGGGLEVPDSEKVKLWDLESKNLFINLTDSIKSYGPGIKSAESVAFSPNGKYIAVGFQTGSNVPGNSFIVIWNNDGFKTIAYNYYPSIYIMKIKFSPDGKFLAAVFWYQKSNYVLLIDTETWDEKMPALHHPDIIKDLTFTSDGTKLITGCDDGNIRIWNTKNFTLEQNNKMPEQVFSIDISNDNKHIFAGGIWGLKKIDLSNQKDVYNYNTNFNRLGYELIRSISIPSKGNELVCGSYGTVGLLKSDLLSNILENKNQESELIFPNPATGIVKIAFLNPMNQFLKITISNYNGSLEDILFKGDMAEGLRSIEYDTRKLLAGTYFIQISSSNFSKTFKLVKE